MHDESKNKQNSPVLEENCCLTAATEVGELSPIIRPLFASDLNNHSPSV
jgi:hypothetical protein